MAAPLQLGESHRWRGEWWLPSSPETRVAGTLVYEPLEGAHLELVGALYRGDRRQTGPGSYVITAGPGWIPAVYGVVESRPITLTQCLVARGAVNLSPLTESVQQDVLPTTVMLGGHVGDETEPQFDRIVASIEGLTAWSGKQAIDVQLDLKSREAMIASTVPATESVTSGDLTYKLTSTTSGPTRDVGLGVIEARVSHLVELEITSTTPLSLNDAREHVAAVSDLVALAGHRRTLLLGLRGHIVGAPSQEPRVQTWVEVLYQQTTKDSPPDETRRHHLAFQASDTGFAQILTQWLTERTKLRNAVNMVLATWTPGWYLEAQTLNLITALEALDAGLGAKRKLPPEQFRELRKQLVDAIPEEHQQWILGVVQNGLSLQDRLKGLAAMLPPAVARKLLPDPDAWARMARNARNDLSHSGATKLSLEDLAALQQVTEAVAYVLLLTRLGLPDSRIEQLLGQDGRLAHACRLAREHFPSPDPVMP